MSLKDIISTEGIIRIDSRENLSSALSKLSTSHDAAFLFSDDGKYLGVINPYYCLIKSSYPSNAKVEYCVYNAPKIYINYSLSKVAGLFMQSKVHYLPVFDEKDSFLGVVSARRLLLKLRSMSIMRATIKEFLKHNKQKLVVIDDNETISKAIDIFKSTKLSKLIVINGGKKLKAILSYYDLIDYLIGPKNSKNMSFYHKKVKDFAKTFVLTLTEDDLLTDVIRLILEKKIGSVIIVDSMKHPIGITTTKDLLRFFIQKEQRPFSNSQILGGFFNKKAFHSFF